MAGAQKVPSATVSSTITTASNSAVRGTVKNSSATAAPQREHPAPLIRQVPNHGAHHRLDRGGDQERGADPGRAGAQPAEAQWGEHVHRAGRDGGEHHEPHPKHDGRLPKLPGQACAVRLEFRRGRSGEQANRYGQAGRDKHDRGEHGGAAKTVRERADHWTEQGAADSRGQRTADRAASPRRRRLDDQPDHAAGPRARAADALKEPGRIEQGHVVEQAEGEARAAHQRKPGVQRDPGPRSLGQHAARK
jgi:hypothetical protein